MVDVGSGHVIEQQGEKENHPTEGTRTNHLANLQAAVAPTHVEVHPH
jgi:hypothetical protein